VSHGGLSNACFPPYLKERFDKRMSSLKTKGHLYIDQHCNRLAVLLCWLKSPASYGRKRLSIQSFTKASGYL